jgi:hypothetical protein
MHLGAGSRGFVGEAEAGWILTAFGLAVIELPLRYPWIVVWIADAFVAAKA